MILLMMIFFFAFSIVCLAFFVYQYKKNALLTRELKSIHIKHKALENEMKALLRADIIFGQCVTRLKEQLFALDDKQSMLETRRNNEGGYQHALKLLEMGSSIEDIIKDCNLTPAEAELLSNLQAYQMATPS